MEAQLGSKQAVQAGLLSPYRKGTLEQNANDEAGKLKRSIVRLPDPPTDSIAQPAFHKFVTHRNPSNALRR